MESVSGLRSSRSSLSCALEVPRTRRPEWPHAFRLGLHQHVPQRTGALLYGQAQLQATDHKSPDGWILRATHSCVLCGWDWGRVAPEPARWHVGSVLERPGAWHSWTLQCPAQAHPCLPSPSPRSPGECSALLECRRRGCGGQPGAWHLVIKSLAWTACGLQEGCGFEGATPRGLGQPPTDPTAWASASLS